MKTKCRIGKRPFINIGGAMSGGTNLTAARSRRGKSRKSCKRLAFHLDMTPLVDITFLLLTFFMFTTTMTQPQLMEMKLPKEIDPAPVPESRLMTILIDDDSNLYYYMAANPAKKTDLKELSQAAVQHNIEMKNKLITALKISDNATFEAAVKVLDELNMAELQISQALRAEAGADGKTPERERRFTIAPFSKEDKQKIAMALR